MRPERPVFTRRSCLRFFGTGGALVAAQGAFAQTKGETFTSASHRYSDPVTELDVIRLTDPAYSSSLTAVYNRDIARSSAWMLYCCDRSGSPQAFRLDLKTAQTRQLTDAEDLDGATLTLTPDNRAFCYAAGRGIYQNALATERARELYRIPDGWERCEGMSVGPDGTHVLFGERQGAASRVRLVPLAQGTARTVIEAPFELSHPQARPFRAQLLYRQGAAAVWMVNMDGLQNRKLKLAPGRIGTAQWSNDGKTLLYLNLPDDPSQLNSIREFNPDTNADKLVAKTSQFAAFGFNRDSSVFVGASANRSSPVVLILLRITRRELTLCEHKAADPASAAPRFSPDSQRIYFQSDREGKPAIYCVHVERLVEKTESETK